MAGHSTTAVTVVTRSHLPTARVLAASIAAHDPDMALSVIVLDWIDGPPPVVAGASRVEGPSALGIEAEGLDILRALYDPLALCCAAKPFALLAELDSGADVAVWLDADIELFAPLSSILGPLARESPLVLTPHYPELRRPGENLPSDNHLLISGAFNLGLAAVAPSSRPFLEWWAERCARHCVVQHDAGLMLDQRWVDLAAGAVPHHVLRDPGINAGYWNLAGRALDEGSEGPTIDGEPLRALHFSGFDPDHPDVLTSHLRPHPRVDEDQPVVARLLHHHARCVLAATDPPPSPAWPWEIADDGTRLTPELRARWRDELLLAEAHDTPGPPSPWDDRAAFSNWVAARR